MQFSVKFLFYFRCVFLSLDSNSGIRARLLFGETDFYM